MDAAIEEILRDNYLAWIELPNGNVLAIVNMIYTTGLCVGIHRSGYQWRYCYENTPQAFYAMTHWDGEGHPPGPWIKLKGHPDGELLGPGATA